MSSKKLQWHYKPGYTYISQTNQSDHSILQYSYIPAFEEKERDWVDTRQSTTGGRQSRWSRSVGAGLCKRLPLQTIKCQNATRAAGSARLGSTLTALLCACSLRIHGPTPFISPPLFLRSALSLSLWPAPPPQQPSPSPRHPCSAFSNPRPDVLCVK